MNNGDLEERINTEAEVVKFKDFIKWNDDNEFEELRVEAIQETGKANR